VLGKHGRMACWQAPRNQLRRYRSRFGTGPAGNEPPLQLRWEQINAVFAYKRDCYTVDQLRLILGNDLELTWMEVTEDDVGFKVLIVELARRLPGFPTVYDWWDNVAHPPFETQWTELYRRTAPVR